MSNLVHNEQMKLAANLFNNLAVVSLASGFLAPIFSTRTSATPIGFSEGEYAILGVVPINARARCQRRSKSRPGGRSKTRPVCG